MLLQVVNRVNVIGNYVLITVLYRLYVMWYEAIICFIIIGMAAR